MSGKVSLNSDDPDEAPFEFVLQAQVGVQIVDNDDSGSEVGPAMEAHGLLAADGIKAQVVSMPSWELFEAQDKQYQDSVLPPGVKARVGIEAGVRQGWDKWLGDKGVFIWMSSFGASAPASICFEKFGITAEAITQAARQILNG